MLDEKIGGSYWLERRNNEQNLQKKGNEIVAKLFIVNWIYRQICKGDGRKY